jgi:hypothetical protein
VQVRQRPGAADTLSTCHGSSALMLKSWNYRKIFFRTANVPPAKLFTIALAK